MILHPADSRSMLRGDEFLARNRKTGPVMTILIFSRRRISLSPLRRFGEKKFRFRGYPQRGCAILETEVWSFEAPCD